MTDQRTTGAIIEIIERTNDPDPTVIMPTEVRIQGHRLYTSADEPIVIERISIEERDCVRVTLTLLAKRVTIAAEPKTDPKAQPDTLDLVDGNGDVITKVVDR